jgi:hypothetical protein
MADECPNCGNTLTYDHYMDSMKCLFCNYRQSIAIPTHIEEDNNPTLQSHNNRYELDKWEKTDAEMSYAEDDDVDYGNFVEG